MQGLGIYPITVRAGTRPRARANERTRANVESRDILDIRLVQLWRPYTSNTYGTVALSIEVI
jgi:hypothetical protein